MGKELWWNVEKSDLSFKRGFKKGFQFSETFFMGSHA